MGKHQIITDMNPNILLDILYIVALFVMVLIYQDLLGLKRQMPTLLQGLHLISWARKAQTDAIYDDR